MVAALSPQWIGIAVASAVVVILLVILILRRRTEGKEAESSTTAAPSSAPLGPTPPAPAPAPQPAVQQPQPPAPAAPDTTAPSTIPAAPAAGSFLDEPLEGGFEGLGRRAGGQPALGTVVLPKDMRPAASPPPPAPASTSAPESPPGPPHFAADASLPAAEVAPQPPAPQEAPEPAPPAGGDQAALSDIIVTTNRQEIDLTDPDVRAMLEELVCDEMALAEAYQQQGQILDAILQLTEAEKACTALGDTERAEKIKAMLKELQP